MMRRPRQHSPDHLAFVRSLPCCVCGDDISVEAAHVRFADNRAAKRSVGIGEKADDKWTLPLCGRCHRKQHTMDERKFWQGRDPIFICLALWSVSGDYEAGEIVVRVQLGDIVAA